MKSCEDCCFCEEGERTTSDYHSSDGIKVLWSGLICGKKSGNNTIYPIKDECAEDCEDFVESYFPDEATKKTKEFKCGVFFVLERIQGILANYGANNFTGESGKIIQKLIDDLFVELKKYETCNDDARNLKR